MPTFPHSQPSAALCGLASPTLLPVRPWFPHFTYFLSWPLRGLPWPPRGLASPTLLPVMAPARHSVAPAWPCFTHFASCHGPCVAFASCHGPCVAFRGPRVALLHLLCFLSWCLRGIPWPPRGLASPTLLPVVVPAWHSVVPTWPCFTYFASCRGACVAFRGPHVALLHLLCFLSWPLRGLASPTLLRVMTLVWPSAGPAWPCVTHSASCHDPYVAFRGPAWPCFTYFASCHDRCVAFCGPRVALLCLLCFLSCVAFRGRRVALLWSLFPVLALAWPAAWPCFAYVASCHGPCVAFRGPRVALPHLRCFLSRYFASCHAWPSVTAAWPYSAHFLLCFLSWPRGLPWPPRGLASPTLLPVIPAWPFVAAAWPYFAHLACAND